MNMRRKILLFFGIIALLFFSVANASVTFAENESECSGAGQPCCNLYTPPCDNGLTCTNVGEAGFYCYDENSPIPITTPPSPLKGNIHGNCGETEIDTAIGCIPVLGNDGGAEFTEFVLGWAIGVGGGIAFLLILYAGFMLMTSTGNPERIKAGQELLTSAISGLILLIFSVFILNFIGINILGIFK
jgi:hypothetical protein